MHTGLWVTWAATIVNGVQVQSIVKGGTNTLKRTQSYALLLSHTTQAAPAGAAGRVACRDGQGRDALL